MAKLVLIACGDVGIGEKKLECFGKEIVEVHRVRLLFTGFVLTLDSLDVLSERDEVAVFLRQNLRDGGAGVNGKAEDVGEDTGFRETLVRRHHPIPSENGGDHVF